MGPASPLMVRRTFSYASPATPTHGHFSSLKLLSPFSVRIILAHHHLLVDVAGQRLLVTDSYCTTPLSTSPATHITVCSVDSSPVQTLIADYSDVFKPELHQQRHSPAKHGIHHHITTSGALVYSRFRRLNPEKLAPAKTSFTEMERMGICSKASSPWASPLHMVHKSDGSWRPCGDYRRLNLITEPDHYPMPNIADFTNSIGTARVFSKLDLLKGYFQVPVHPADVPSNNYPVW